jgi:hypothetical protein
MKKTSFVVALLISAALAGCHHKKAATTGSGSGDTAGSAAGSAAGSGDAAGSAAGSGGGSGGM